MKSSLGSFLKGDHLQAVIWIQTAYLGDIILTFIAAQELKKTRTHLHQYIITTPGGVELAKPLGLFQKCLAIDKSSSFRATLTQAKEGVERLDLQRGSGVVLQAHRSFRSSVIAMMLRARHSFATITYQDSAALPAFFYRNLHVKVPRSLGIHESERLKLLLAPLGVLRREGHLAASTMISEAEKQELIKAHPFQVLDRMRNSKKALCFVALVPGSQGPAKRWPVSHWAELTAQLLQREDVFVVVVGGKREQKLAFEMKQILEGKGVRDFKRWCDLSGKTSLEELWGLYARFDLVIGGDSSSTHFGSALGVPCFVLYGPTDPTLGFGPLSKKSRMLSTPTSLSCQPCSLHGLLHCPLKHHKCMTSLTPSYVGPFVRSFLRQFFSERSVDQEEEKA